MKYCKSILTAMMLFTLTGCGQSPMPDSIVVWLLNR